MSFLIDTNVISELRKGDRAAPPVRDWFADIADADLYLSVLVIGEVRKGIERIRRRDPKSAVTLEAWLQRVTGSYGDRILPVTAAVADTWGRFNADEALPVIDSLLAATAHVHGLTVATRNTADIGRTGVPTVDPFTPRS